MGIIKFLKFIMIDFFRSVYYAFYDIPKNYIGIKGERELHIFTVLSILLLISFITFMTKNIIETHKLIKHNKKIKRSIEKKIYGILNMTPKSKRK